MSEPDIFYILGNKVRRDLLSHLTCTECYFSLLSNKVSVSSTAVSKHLKIMEREGLLKSYEKEGKFIGPVRKYYKITLSSTYVVTVTPNLFWYRGIKLDEKPKLKRFEIDLENLEESPNTLQSMVLNLIDANKQLHILLEALKSLESYRDMLVKTIKERYLEEIGDMTQLAILHYLMLYGEATIEDLSDRLNIKEREVIKKAEELNKFVPLTIKDRTIKIDEEKLRKVAK
ncbi:MULTISPECIES: sulfur metabolism transcriptional regulator SurR [Thermococcus]|uniref:Sulfur response regulator n=2 Tax=Thermococcus barophilus TaxID=55802 RepID=A0A0S1XAF0_THEBA|nr:MULTISPECIES: ArsR family transcriptional regulator [Thermococcus]ADT83633.1 archaeal heat shock regulator [Thermococcus barophilus MP]ALM74735.1 Sulfur response regulator [Thermococcus barophilus]WRS52847.1 ArsR family transcriptional regulator [Thermococcus sp. SY098]